MTGWNPNDGELDAVARGIPGDEPTVERAEHNRTSVLAGAVALRQQPRHAPWRVAVSVALPLAAAAAIATWIGTRPSDSHSKVSMTGDGARYSVVSELPDELVRLDDGTLDVAIDGLDPAERFRVQAPDAEVGTTGARFVVAVQGAHVNAVTVSRGSVELRVMGAPPVFLSTGRVWTRTLTASRDTLLEPKVPVANTTEPALPSATPSASPSAPSTVSAIPTKSDRRVSVTAPTAELSPPTRSNPSPSLTTTPATPSTQVATTPAADTPPPTPPSSMPGEADFRAGIAALRTGDTVAATSAFASACAAPRSVVAEDACFWVGAAARRAGQTSAARGALENFLRRFPASARAGEAAALLGWILFEAGELEGADRLFKQAASDRVPRVRDSATRGQQAVERKRH